MEWLLPAVSLGFLGAAILAGLVAWALGFRESLKKGKRGQEKSEIIHMIEEARERHGRPREEDESGAEAASPR